MSNQGTIVSRSSLIAAGALSSRITGFIRTSAIGAALGASLVGNSYATSIMLPSVIYEILLGGVGAAVLIPLLNRAKETQADGGRELAQRLLSFAVLAFAVTAVIATAAIPVIIPSLGGQITSGASTELTIAFSMFTIPAIFFYGVGAVATAVLNARGTFALPAWSPACNNLTLIAAAIILMSFPADEFGDLRIALLGGATLFGAALQTAILFPAILRSGVSWSWKPSLRGFGLRKLTRTLGWVTAYVAVGQVAVLVIIGLTRAAAEKGGPGPLIYNNAWILLMMAYGVLSLPVITALAPALSERTSPESAATADTYRMGIRLIVLTALPAVAGMVALAEPVAITVFQWGNYTHADALATGTVIAAGGVALIPYALSQLQLFAFLAIGDARTSALIMSAASGVRIVLCLAAYAALPADYIAAALMTANALSYTLAVVAATPVLRRRLGIGRALGYRTVLRSIAAVLGLVVLSLVTWSLAEHLIAGPKLAAFVALAVTSPVFGLSLISFLKRSKGLLLPMT